MDLISTSVVIILLAAIFGFCGWIIWRHWVNKEWINEGSRLVGRSLYSDFQNADKRDAIEHVIYMSEDEREEDDEGEGFKPKFDSKDDS